jgi:hypothetical protein
MGMILFSRFDDKEKAETAGGALLPVTAFILTLPDLIAFPRGCFTFLLTLWPSIAVIS